MAENLSLRTQVCGGHNGCRKKLAGVRGWRSVGKSGEVDSAARARKSKSLRPSSQSQCTRPPPTYPPSQTPMFAINDLGRQTVSASSGAGRHTTSASKLYCLEDTQTASSGDTAACAGAPTIVIDTPGVRTFRPSVTAQTDFVKGFPEMAELERECRHAPRCLHMFEAVGDCAVLSAVAAGRLSESRYASYAHMMLEERRPLE